MIKKFEASLDSLSEMVTFIRSAIEAAGFSTVNSQMIELAAEEAFVNIVNYGYPEGTGHIDMECIFKPNFGLTIIIKDLGIPYDPLINLRTFERRNCNDLSPGGLGIYLIIKAMDEIHYARDKDSNILTLIKYFQQNS